jgi:NAD(P)-dependent dehydrogenase (short-subunit alcohol dehydrogenase family)
VPDHAFDGGPQIPIANTASDLTSCNARAHRKDAVVPEPRAALVSAVPVPFTGDGDLVAGGSPDPAGGTLTDERKAAMSADIPLGRVGTVHDVAALLTFLMSADAGYITVATYDVNGGLQIS